MEDHPVRTAADIALGTSGVTAPAWFPILHNVNEVAATVAAIGGAVLVLIRLYFALVSFSRHLKNGKLPKMKDGDV